MTSKTLLQAVVALLVGAALWYGLTRWAIRVEHRGETAQYELGWAWLVRLLAFLAIFGGALTILRGAGERGSAQEGAARVLAGIAGVLAGATLLEIGQWYVPAALAAVAIAAAVVAVARRAPAS